jgi:histone H3/H4
LSGSHDDASPAKKAKIAQKSGKTANTSASKPKSKPKKAPIKTIPAKTISTICQEYGHEAANGHGSSNSRSVITKEILEQTAKSVSQTLTLEEEAKAGVILYMEQFINRLVHDTGRATNLRKSKMIQNKDVEYALKFKTDSINS